jgi:hypothetical protein
MLRYQMLCNEFGAETFYSIGVRHYRESVILRLISCPPAWPVTTNLPSPAVLQLVLPSTLTLLPCAYPHHLVRLHP